MTVTNFCTSCGTQVPPNSRFCTSCGAQAAAAPPPAVNAAPPVPPYAAAQAAPAYAAPAAAPAAPWAPSPSAPPPPWAAQAAPIAGAIPIPQRRESHWKRNVVVGVVVFIAAVIGISLLATSGPADAVDRHLSLLAKGDVATAYAETDPGFKQAASPAQFAQIVATYPILKNNTASWTSRSVTGDQGIVQGTLTAPDKSRANVEYHLAKGSDGTWRVLGFQVTPVP